MFSTVKVGQTIRHARIAANMTQMELADSMGVSYQAVSNWERGNSMPDISKLEQLCDILHISVAQLLGQDDPQTETVEKLIKKEEVEPEALLEVAPILPPEQAKEAARQSESISWETIIQLAVFLDEQTLDQLVERAQQEGAFEYIVSLAPFLSEKTLNKLVMQCDGEVDMGMVLALAPFLDSETVEHLAEKSLKDGDMDRLTALAPFLGSGALKRLIDRMMGKE